MKISRSELLAILNATPGVMSIRTYEELPDLVDFMWCPAETKSDSVEWGPSIISHSNNTISAFNIDTSYGLTLDSVIKAFGLPAYFGYNITLGDGVFINIHYPELKCTFSLALIDVNHQEFQPGMLVISAICSGGTNDFVSGPIQPWPGYGPFILLPTPTRSSD